MILNKQDIVRIAFVGDLFLGGEYISYAKRSGINILSAFDEVLPITESADVLVLNLEGPIFEDSHYRRDATAVLSNDPEIVNFISRHKDCVVNLANNHIMDYGNEGLYETLDILKKNKIKYLGAGKNYSEANQELILNVKNKSIAFIACTSNEARVGAIIAEGDNSGCASYDNVANLLTKIKILKNKVDTVCVLLHWGYEYFQYPDPDQINIAHNLVDAGADFVISHHPHVIQGIESYKKALISYSTGNFFFPEFKSTTGRIKYPKKITNEFIILFSDLNDTGEIKYEFIGGLRNDYYKLNMYKSDEKESFVKRMKTISDPFKSSQYQAFWANYKSKRDKELKKENAIEALYKLKKTPIKDLVREISLKDITRNIGRLKHFLK